MVPLPISCCNANFTLRFYPYVVVGYGVAGQAALKALLERDPGARVLVIDASSDGASRFTPRNSSGESSSTKPRACHRNTYPVWPECLTRSSCYRWQSELQKPKGVRSCCVLRKIKCDTPGFMFSRIREPWLSFTWQSLRFSNVRTRIKRSLDSIKSQPNIE